MTERAFTKILDWPWYSVYRHEIDERARTLTLWVKRKRGNNVFLCSHCGGLRSKIGEVRQRSVRDLPWRKYQTVAVVDYYRARCPKRGLKVEVVPQVPGKAPFRKDFEDAVGQDCESAAREVAGSLAWRPERSGPSISGIWSVGPRIESGRCCANWGSMRSTWERRRSS